MIESVNNSENSNIDNSYERIFSIYEVEIDRITEEIANTTGGSFNRWTVEESFVNLAKVQYPFNDFDKFSAISKRRLVMNTAYIDESELISEYLKTLKLVESSEAHFLSVYHENPARNSQVAGFDYSDGLEKPSREFERILRVTCEAFWRRTVNQASEQAIFKLYLTSLLLLSKQYGEEIMTEILSKNMGNSDLVPLAIFMKLMDHWDNVKEYPLQWAIELVREGGSF